MSNVVRRFVQWIAAAALALSIAAPVNAQIWYGSWDPKFGDPFSTASSPAFTYNLGWGGGQGGSFFNNSVFAPCGPQVSVTISNSDDCGGNAKLTSLKVRLYAYPNQTPVFNELDFDPNSLLIDLLRYKADGVLEGIRTTGLSNWVADGAYAPPNGAGTNAEFAIQFVLDGEDCLFCDDFFPALASSYSGPVLFARIPTNAEEDFGCGELYFCTEIGDGFFRLFRSNVNEFPAIVTYVPEPATLSLLAISLIGVGLTRRRRAS